MFLFLTVLYQTEIENKKAACGTNDAKKYFYRSILRLHRDSEKLFFISFTDSTDFKNYTKNIREKKLNGKIKSATILEKSAVV